MVRNEGANVRVLDIGPVADVARSGGWVEPRNTMRIESRPDLFSRPAFCRSHKQRKSGLTLEFDDPVRKPFGINTDQDVRHSRIRFFTGEVRSQRRIGEPPSVELNTNLDVSALNGAKCLHLNFLTIDV